MPTRPRGSIQQRGADRYLVRVYLGTDAAGKRQYASKTVQGTLKDAQVALTDLLGRADQRTLVCSTTDTVQELCEAYLAAREATGDLSPKSMMDYRWLLETYIYPSLGGMRVQKVTDDHLVRLILTLRQRGKSPRTIRYAMTVLRNVLGRAVQKGILGRNPMDTVALPRMERAAKAVLTEEQVVRLLDATADRPEGALWAVLLTGGLRPQEALALEWADLDLDKGTVSVSKALSKTPKGYVVGETKTRASRRSLSLPERTVRVLKAWRKASGGLHGLVWKTRTGKPWDVANVRRWWKRTLEELGMPVLPLYRARHTHLSHLVAAGVNLKAISQRAGHSSVAITGDVYAQVLPEAERQVAETLERRLASRG